MATIRDNIEHLIAIRDRARLGAGPTVEAMARHVTEYVTNIKLRETTHAPGEWYRQAPGRAPAYASGKLARGMYYSPAYGGGVRATSIVGNKVDYSRILEFGCVITPVSKKKLHWKDSGSPVKGWFHDLLIVPAHPFLEPSVKAVMQDGSLQRAAIEGFRPYDP